MTEQKPSDDGILEEEPSVSVSDNRNSSSSSDSDSSSSITDSDSQQSLTSKKGKRSAASHRRFSKSATCNLKFPVSRIKTMLKVHNYANRVSETGAVFLTAVLEYATAEILEVSLNAARSDGKTRIKPRHVNVGIKSDLELKKNFMHSTVPEGGFLPLSTLLNSVRPLRIEQNGLASVSKSHSVKKKSKRKISRESRRG